MAAGTKQQHGDDRGDAAQRHPHTGRRKAVSAEGGTKGTFGILIMIFRRGREVGHDRQPSGRGAVGP
jgi:hypothetical protein